MKKMVLLLVLALVASAGSAQTSHVVIEPSEYQEQIQDKEVQLIDVRTPEEFAEGHISGAKNINFHSNDFLARFSKLDKNKTLYIYCKSGNRSGKAARELSEIGFKHVVDLRGGFLAWKELTEQ